MRKRAIPAGCLAAFLTIVLAGIAQEGHPLTGTWSGDWGPNLDERNHVTLVVEYDGDEIGGLINPGPDSVEVDRIALDPTDWTVRIQASGPGGENIRAEGRLDNLESYHRTLSGTWRQGSVEGDFKLTRD